jgi:protein-S-isoprenylcysteine O-methyltransferase Ste14
MSPRGLLRIFVSVLLVALFWLKVARNGHDWPVWRIGLGAILSAALIVVVIAQMKRFDRRSHRLRDEVPKKPLGLDT